MQLDQYLIFFIIAWVATGLAIIISLLAYQRRTSPGASTFSFLMLLVALWTFSIAMGMVSQRPSGAFIWAFLRMVGVFMVPVFWFAFAVQFTDRETRVDWPLIGISSILPMIFTLLMATSNYHDLFLINIQYMQAGPFLIDARWELGPLFYVHVAYSYLLILAGVFTIFREALRLSRSYRGQTIALISAVVLPLITNTSYTFHLIPGLNVNYDPLGFVLSGLIYAWALFRHRIFDIIPVARRMLFDIMTDGVIVVDHQERIIDLNPAARDLLPEFEHSPIGEPLSVWLPEITRLKQRDSSPGATLELTMNQRVYDVQVSLIDGQLPQGSRFYVFRDITNRKQLEAELKYLSITDPLTSVFNLRHFLDLGRAEVAKTHRHGEPFSIVLADIDHFKRVNDQYGHLVGDQVLQSISQFYLSNIRIEDIFARYGGEEFILGLPKTNAEQAYLLAERLRQGIEDSVHQTDTGPINLTISMGVATLNGQSNLALRRLIDRADQALYAAKKSGRNCVRFWVDDLPVG